MATLRQELAGATDKYPENRVIHALFGHQAKRKMAMDHANVIRKRSGDLLEQAVIYVGQTIVLLTRPLRKLST